MNEPTPTYYHPPIPSPEPTPIYIPYIPPGDPPWIDGGINYPNYGGAAIPESSNIGLEIGILVLIIILFKRLDINLKRNR